MRFAFFLFLILMSGLQAQTVIEASGELPAEILESHGDTVGGIGSGMVYDAKNDVFLCVSDRGPGDGTLPYRPRYVVLKLTQSGDKLEPKIIDSIFLRDEKGRAMTGLIPDDKDAPLPRMKDGRTCIDPEAIAIAPDDTLYITDEYGPYLYQFQRDGKLLRRLELPEDFQPRTKDGKPDFTDKAELLSGRNINQGPEGMCLLPDGQTAALVFQSGLIQDGGHDSGISRIVLMDLASGKATAMYHYLTSPEQAGVEAGLLSVNDLAALSATRFLVLERDNRGRDGAIQHAAPKSKSVWLIDTSDATNLLSEHSRITPVKKKLVFNLVDLVPNPAQLSAKWETIALLPRPDSGDNIHLLMAADNDFLASTIHEEGQKYSFPRAEDTVPTQFYKIRVKLPENP